jgi:solute:Na+ symporter, SSS family
MAVLDWIVIVIFMSISIGIGLYFTRLASKGKENFFLAGRSLGWFVAGTSIVATTFSADTPIWVAGWSRSQGISGNWIWWCAAIGQIGGTFFLARYWRRSEVVTEVDMIRLRYGKSATSNLLRGFKVVFDGILVNCVIMASVTLAMAKVITIVLDLSNKPVFTMPLAGEITPTALILITLTVIVLLYSTLSGLYGAVYVDVFQFLFAMFGCIILAIIVYIDASGGEGMLAKLKASPDFNSSTLDIIPDITVWNASTFTFLLYVGIVWWMSFPTTGFHVQKLLSTKTEKDSMKAFLWYNFANYVLRSWPWIVVGILAMIYYPNLENPEDGYARTIADFMPIGLKGIMVSVFFAAYMSTISTHLTWGTAYIVNDLYQAFIFPKASQKHLIYISRTAIITLAIIVAIISTRLQRIVEVYKFLMLLWAGIGTCLIARWYWWRVTAAAEFVTMAITLFLTFLMYVPSKYLPFFSILLEKTGYPVPEQGPVVLPVFHKLLEIMNLPPDELAIFGLRIGIMSIIPLMIWIPYVLITSRKPSESAVNFYKKIQISSWGWRKIEKETGIKAPKGEFLINLFAWLVSCLTLFTMLVGIGNIIFHKFLSGLLLLGATILFGIILFKLIKKMQFGLKPTQ